MKNLVIIPARAGSKRILNKNTKLLGGLPLINWTINTVKSLNLCADFLVSTDDEKIAQIAINNGLMLPWLRPKNISDDSTSMFEVLVHAIDWYEENICKIYSVILLQPTSPFRSTKDILTGIQLFKKHNSQTVISVTKSSIHPSWQFKIERNYLVPYINFSDLNKRSQDLKDVYNVNGSFYMFTPKYLKKNKSLYSEKVIPLIIKDQFRAIDIDDEWDWFLAERILEKFKKRII